MFQLLPIILASALALFHCSIAQQFPPPVTYDTVLQSPINPNITIAYKSPKPGTCLTAFDTQKQYSGYVNLPPFTLTPYQQNYSINTFFWFFEARTNPETAPLTIWLNGGPGSSSMIGLFRESGPCEVVQSNDGSYGTQPNMWGWDRSSNVLFIDQPTQTGFSYDDAVNASVNLINNQRFSPQPAPKGVPAWSWLNGTFSSGHEYSTQNTSLIAASASWHFLQGFLSAFPQYNPGIRPNSTTTEPTGVNLFAESYGGVYGPAFANLFEAQNAKRITGDIPRNSTLEIRLTSVGIINGLVDQLIQAPFWPTFGYNNTYGIQVIDQTTQLNALSDFSAPEGCRELITQCRDSMATNDPQGEGDDESTNSICEYALQTCNSILQVVISSNRSVYDIRVENPNSFPNYAYLEYLNNADVLGSIGAKVNFTESSMDVVFNAFGQTGDQIRGTQITSLANLLTLGVRVAFIYGDADLICNWYGGEAVSLQLARHISNYSSAFPSAGYADIITNRSYVGGQVRQYGNLSFSRIYDAGHTVPSYQPETAFTVFTRIIEGNDIGTGNEIDLSTFVTKGPKYSPYRNKVPNQPKSTCWIRAIRDTCTVEEQTELSQGNGVVKNGMWLAKESDYTPAETQSIVGKPGSLQTVAPTQSPTTTSVIPLTGVYTATGTSTPTSGASSSRLSFRVQPRQFIPSLGRNDLSYFDEDRDVNNEKRRRLKKRLGLGLGLGLGTLVFLLLLAALLVALIRRHRSSKAAPVSQNVTPEPEPRKGIFVQRFVVRRPAKTGSMPTVVPIDIGRPKTPPPLPADRRASLRRHTLPMESIPEQDHSLSPRHSERFAVDNRPINAPGTPRQSSTYTNEPIIPNDSTNPAIPAMQHNVVPPSQQPTLHVIEEPTAAPSRKPSIASGVPTPATSRKPSVASEEVMTTPSQQLTAATAEAIRSTQRSASIPQEEIASSFGNSKAASGVTQELNDKKAEERVLTPPPRVATAPPQRASTAKVPERAPTTNFPTTEEPEPPAPK